ncbi:hypothetical protein DPEC_G00102110 [Dallia pectoralis]|uniref:Uncharacterized protein n=1 Tax=Dallia pectoralis TaxID=75939 RepID=A0ACC2GX61_DALPE|nr:hypothetical protein DPEC_G00102110 [Dallia pectoralis]
MDAARKILPVARPRGRSSGPYVHPRDPNSLPPPSRPARQRGPLGQVIAQYLGQHQPLTAQALQAKLIKVIKPSMKLELAQIVDDYENSVSVQVDQDPQSSASVRSTPARAAPARERRCMKNVVAWSQGIIRQLDETHRCLFPAILTYRLSFGLRW